MTTLPLRAALVRASLTVFALSHARPVLAEDIARKLAVANAHALQALQTDDLRRARSRLQRALRAAKRAGTRGPLLARTYANLGIVYARSGHSRARAVRAFRRALAEDESVAPEHAMMDDAVTAAFREAQDRAGGASRGRDDVEAVADPSDPSADRGERSELTLAPPAEPDAPEVADVPAPWEVARADEPQPSVPPRAVLPEPVAQDDDAVHRDHDDHPRWFIEMGLGVGFSALKQGHAPDRLPGTTTIETLSAETDHAKEKVSPAEIERELREEGWDCEARTNEGEVHAEDCVVAAPSGVSVMEPIFDVAFGYHVLPRLSFALTSLVQRNHGAGPMAGVLVGVRSEVLVTRPAPRGPQFGAIAGFGIGTLQARGRGTHHDAPHASNAGPGAIGASVTLGAKGAYRVNRHLAFGVTPLLNIGLPYLLYDVGMTGGVEVAF